MEDKNRFKLCWGFGGRVVRSVWGDLMKELGEVSWERVYASLLLRSFVLKELDQDVPGCQLLTQLFRPREHGTSRHVFHVRCSQNLSRTC